MLYGDSQSGGENGNKLLACVSTRHSSLSHFWGLSSTPMGVSSPMYTDNAFAGFLCGSSEFCLQLSLLQCLCYGLDSQLRLLCSRSPGLCPSRAGGGVLWVHLVYSLCLRDYFPLLPDVHGVTDCFTYFPLYLGCSSREGKFILYYFTWPRAQVSAYRPFD